ncbi:MAG: phage/plasmid primase, P4 family [Eubacteriales bacterium]|nr:phage/plasmid primase, P4 family [Eubacteriales bacterium]
MSKQTSSAMYDGNGSQNGSFRDIITFTDGSPIDAITFMAGVPAEISGSKPSMQLTNKPIEPVLDNMIVVTPTEQQTALEAIPAVVEAIPAVVKATLPEAPLTDARIHMPIPLDKELFKKSEVVEVVEEKRNMVSVRLYKKLLNEYKLRVYCGDVYLFDEVHGIYRKLSTDDLNYLINLHFREIIEKCGLYLYDEILMHLKVNYEIAVQEADFQPLQYWGFQNGFCDIYKGTCIVNDGRYFVRNVLTCDYHSKAICPTFDKFLNSIACGDNRIINLIWETIGYLFSNDTNAKRFFAFIGCKNSGKSLLARVITNIIGNDATTHLSPSDFAGRFSLSGLNGKKLNTCMDLPNRALSPEVQAIIKEMTGNDIMYSDVKYKDAISFKPTARLLFGSNYLIKTQEYDSAFEERLIVIPFRYSIPRAEQDFDLERKLLLEKEGICLKAMQYYKALIYKRYHFTDVDLSRELENNIDDNKVIEYFANECCEFTDSKSDKVFSTTLYEAYRDYCHSKDLEPLKNPEFSRKFNDKFSGRVIKKKININGECLNGFVYLKLKQ